jgi:hypothetical protein
MQNWQFGLPGRILFEQSFWCQIKWWACSWLCSSTVSQFSVSVNLNFPCGAHGFFPERLSNHCQGLCCTFSEMYTNFYAVPVSDPSRNRKDLRICTPTQLREIVYTDSQDMLVLSYSVASHYYNCCTDGNTNPVSYGYPRSYRTYCDYAAIMVTKNTDGSSQK